MMSWKQAAVVHALRVASDSNGGDGGAGVIGCSSQGGMRNRGIIPMKHMGEYSPETDRTEKHPQLSARAETSTQPQFPTTTAKTPFLQSDSQTSKALQRSTSITYQQSV